MNFKGDFHFEDYSLSAIRHKVECESPINIKQTGQARHYLNKYMTFEEYQNLSRKTAVYPKEDGNFNYSVTYPALGLASEAGEVAGKIKKSFRDNGGVITDERREEIKKELGDVLWYVAQLATELKLSLDEIAFHNIEKLLSRQKRGKLAGDGDDR